MKKRITLKNLQTFNLFMAALHAVQAVVIMLISSDFSLPVVGNFLRYNSSTQVLESSSRELFQLPFAGLIASFFIVSSVAHLLIATKYHKRYDADLNKGINKARWIEYSISASIMMVAISMLVGVYDAASLLMIFALTSVMNLMGLVMEVHNQTTKKTSWLSYIVGCISGIVPWLVIVMYFWFGALDGSKAPTFVYWIFVSIFIFFNCFALNMYLQYKKIGKWADYRYGERAYIILSLVAKTVLAWQVFAGTLRP
jgi:hypothetical protein